MTTARSTASQPVSSVEELLEFPGPRETVAYSCPPQLSGVQTLSVANTSRLCRVYHETYTICTIRRGWAEWVYRRGLHGATAGDLMLMEPGELHATVKMKERIGTYRVVLIPAAIIGEMLQDGASPAAGPHLALAALTRPDLFRSFEFFHDSIKADASPLELQSRLAVCVQGLLQHCAEKPPPTRRHISSSAVAAVRDVLNDSYRAQISLAQLARMVGVSPYHLCREFAREVGLPPHAYQAQVRLARAQAMLQKGCPPVLVATQTGFCDQPHLTRAFRRAFGITPAVYQRMTTTR